jgi:hypothetical protein
MSINAKERHEAIENAHKTIETAYKTVRNGERSGTPRNAVTLWNVKSKTITARSRTRNYNENVKNVQKNGQ